MLFGRQLLVAVTALVLVPTMAHAGGPLTGIKPASPVVGFGFSFLDAQVRQPCLADVATDVDPQGATGSHSLVLITSSQSMKEELGLSAAASFGFGIYSGSVAASYYQGKQVSRYAAYLHVLVVQNTGTRKLRNQPSLAAGVPSPIRRPNEFFLRCGDRAFIAASSGGQYEAFLRIETKTSQQQSRIETALSGGILNFGNASLKSDLSRVMTENEAHITSTQYMDGVIAQYPASELGAIIEFAQNFGGLAAAHPTQNVLSDFQEMPYSAMVALPPDNSGVSDFLDRLASRFEEISKVLGSIDYIRRHPDEQFSSRFIVPDGMEQQLGDMAEQVRAMARACARDRKKCTGTIPALPSDFRLPERMVWYPPNGSTPAVFNEFVQGRFHPVGTVPPNAKRVLEVRGTWYCGGGCPPSYALNSSMSYQVVDSHGKIIKGDPIQGDPITNGLIEIDVAGTVRVRVNDDYTDDNFVTNQPIQAAIW